MADSYDLIAIGAGPAGEAATQLASFFGLRAAVIEREKPGGTVTTTGGVPTKALREAAVHLADLRRANRYGLRVEGSADVVIDAIRRRTLSVCDLLQRQTAENLAANGVEYIAGAARLEGERTVVVTRPGADTRRLRARAVIIATGSRPFRPPGIRFDVPGICDTDTILNRGKPPQSIVIVGGGPVGVELATICHALGAKVVLVERGPGLLGSMDRELVDRLEALFVEWGVSLRLGATVTGAGRIGADALSVRLQTGEIFAADTLLFAAGRIPNTEGLGLAEAGVDVDERGRIVVDEAFRTSAPGIYAAGDVLRPTLASIAMEQGRAAVCGAFGIAFEGTVDPCPVSAVYGMPEVSGAGLTEEDCRARRLDYEVGRADLSRTPRGAIAERGGLLKLIFRRSDRRLVGVHAIGDIASEIVGIGQMVIRCGGTVDTIATMSLNTPTYSYAYKYAAADGLRRIVIASRGERGESGPIDAHRA